MSPQPTFSPDFDSPDRWHAAGNWQIDTARDVAGMVFSGPIPEHAVATIDARAIESLDAAGAMLLLHAAERLGLDPDAVELQERHRALFETVRAARDEEDAAPDRTEPAWFRLLADTGEGVVGIVHAMRLFTGFVGLSLSSLVATMWRPRQWRITSTVHHMQQTGLNALPLVALLSFLVGAVVAYLGATVLKDFGAELFVVDLTTYAFFREFGVLLTAILLAGRTASAFTAQIGTMKAREEIDAMRTIGLDPVLLLVLPRLVALIIMLPILATVATLAGLLGGLTVSALSLEISADLFLSRVGETIELRHYLVGLSKAPLFAVVIALVGCLEGFKVTGTAQSVGERTTSAVVQTISLVIVIDALAAVFFMEVGW